jgi:DNA-binding LytR/AlgR family response regulator
MKEKFSILIIEDDIIYEEYMLGLLKKEKIVDVDVVDNYISAVELMLVNKYDVILIDVFINGDKTGATLGKYINDTYKIPFIYVTSGLSSQMLEILKDTHPVAVISKPIDSNTFISNVKLAVYNNRKRNDDLQLINDRIFVKKDGVFEKIYIKDIVYIESDHVYNYVHLISGDKLLVRGRLMDFYDKFPAVFIQINKKNAINVNFIDHFDRSTITVNNKVLDVGRKYKISVYGRLVSF